MSNPNCTHPSLSVFTSKKLLYSVEEVAHILSITEWYVKRLIRTGELKTCSAIGRSKIAAWSIEEFVLNTTNGKWSDAMKKQEPLGDFSPKGIEKDIPDYVREQEEHAQWFYESFLPDSEHLFTPDELAHIFVMDTKAVDGLLDSGELPWVSIQGQRYIHYFWALEWAEENPCERTVDN